MAAADQPPEDHDPLARQEPSIHGLSDNGDAYRSAKHEAHLEALGFKSRIHRKKPQGRPMPKHVSRANAAKSAVRAHPRDRAP
jgi:hypothetical protein